MTAFRENLYDAILRGDMESMYNCVEALELAGKKKAGIKSSVSGRMERIYRMRMRTVIWKR